MKFPKKFNRRSYRAGYMRKFNSLRIATQVRSIREGMGLNQTEFGQRIGQKQSVVSRIEDPEYGNYSLNTLYSIADALDVAVIVKFARFSRFLSDNETFSSSDTELESYDCEASATDQAGTAAINVKLHSGTASADASRILASMSSSSFKPRILQVEDLTPWTSLNSQTLPQSGDKSLQTTGPYIQMRARSASDSMISV